MSECEEECEDDVRRRQVRADSQSSVSEDEEFEVVRMVTECLARHNHCNESDGAFNDDEDAPGEGGDVFGEEDLTNVLHESKIP